MTHFLSETWAAQFGYLGVAFYVCAYGGIQLGVLTAPSVIHTLMNLLAASSVLISLQVNFNMSSAMIQVFWIALSIIGLTRMYFYSRPVLLDKDRSEVAARLMPGLALRRAAVVLRKGRWATCHNGELTREGEPVAQITYLLRGRADVVRGGKYLRTMDEPALVGEVTCISGGPAMATVTLTEPSYLFVIERSTLVKVLQKNPDICRAVEDGIQAAVKEKLNQSNELLQRHRGTIGGTNTSAGATPVSKLGISEIRKQAFT